MQNKRSACKREKKALDVNPLPDFLFSNYVAFVFVSRGISYHDQGKEALTCFLPFRQEEGIPRLSLFAIQKHSFCKQEQKLLCNPKYIDCKFYFLFLTIVIQRMTIMVTRRVTINRFFFFALA